MAEQDPKSSFAFITTMSSCPWGGSEELWSQTAVRLAKETYGVSASLPWWPTPPARLSHLENAGVELCFRQNSLGTKIRKFLSRKFNQGLWLDAKFDNHLRGAALTIISQGANHDGIAYMQYCLQRGIPYVTIVQANAEHWWPDDSVSQKWAELYRNARLVCFVSEANRLLLETQIGESLTNARVVRNPFNVAYENQTPWPSTDGGYSLACVARLDPAAKGQDILFRVLSMDKWRERPLSVTLYGDGPSSETLARLTANWSLQNVRLAGYAGNIAEVWEQHHALILPSRLEGLPLAIVEAMLCQRIAITTAVAGNPEVVTDDVTGFLACAPSVPSLDEAMERAWNARERWHSMGMIAKAEIQKLVPSDPIGDFASLLKDTAVSGIPNR